MVVVLEYRWGIGTIMYGIGGLCEALYAVGGWSPIVFRLSHLFGTVALAGGAIWSSIASFRKRILLHRTADNLLIAMRAKLPAFGGTFRRLSVPGALYPSEYLGIILPFLGFLRATTPMRGDIGRPPEG